MKKVKNIIRRIIECIKKYVFTYYSLDSVEKLPHSKTVIMTVTKHVKIKPHRLRGKYRYFGVEDKWFSWPNFVEQGTIMRYKLYLIWRKWKDESD